MALRAGTVFHGTVGQSSAQVVDGSLQFDTDANTYLTRTPGSEGNRRTWTWSAWIKKDTVGTYQPVFFGNQTGSNNTGNGFRFDNGDKIDFYQYTGSSFTYRLLSNRVLRDVSGWFHIVAAFDTTQSTASDRIKIYLNGEQVTSWGTETYPNQNTDGHVNNNTAQYIGAYNFSDSVLTEKFNGGMSQVYLLDGSAVGPEYFGFTDPLTNTWRPKKYNRTGGINDGRTWSSDMSGTSNSGVYTGMFDGTFTGYEQGVNGATLTYTPTGGLTANSSIRIYLQQSADTYASSADVTVNGSSIKTGAVNSTLGTGSAIGWVDIGTSLTTLTWSNPAGSNNDYRIFAIDVDGVMLIDGLNDPQVWGKNGFYLPFDGNSLIGEAKSGNGNDFTPVNFGGSNIIEKATGALPILNTVNGGRVAIPGTRTDANASSLVLALPLDNIANDVHHIVKGSGSAKTVAVNGDAHGSSDQSVFYDGSFEFDGTNDALRTGTSSDFTLGTGAFTIECWFWRENITDSWQVLVADNLYQNTGGWTLYTKEDDIRFYKGGGEIWNVTEAYNAQTWTHIAVQRDSSGNWSCYINGVDQGVSANDSVNFTDNRICVGGNNYDSGFPVYDYDGYIQDVRIYKGATKYTENFIPATTDPDIVPDTPSGVSLSSNLTKNTNGSVSFDGPVDDYLQLSNHADLRFGSGAFCVEAFVYYTETSGNGTIAGLWNSGSNRRSWLFQIESDQRRLRGFFSSNGSTVTQVNGSTGQMSRNAWHHVAFTRSGNDFRVFLDGVEVGSATSSDSLYDNINDDIGVGSAQGGASSDPITGFISNVRIVKGSAVYTSDFTPPAAPLSNITNTKLLCSQSTDVVSISDVAALPSYDITVTSSNSGAGSVGALTAITSSGNYYYDNRASSGGNGGRAWIQLDFASTQSSVTSIKFSGGAYLNQALFDVYVNGVLVANDKNTNALWAEDEVTISSTNIDSIRIDGSDGYSIGAVKFNNTLVSGSVGGILVNGEAAATNFNPFNTDINAVRGQESNYCTLDPLSSFMGSSSSFSLSNGNLSFLGTGNNDDCAGTLTTPTIGKYFFEATMDANPYRHVAGWATRAGIDTSAGVSGFTYYNAVGSRGNSGDSDFDIVNQGKVVNTVTGGTGTIMGYGLDLDNQEAKIFRNGVLAITTSITTTFGDIWAPVVGDSSSGDASIHVNFGQKPFKFPPPDGFQPLNSSTVRPSTVITRPDQYVGIVTYRGTGATQSITGVGFQPDLVWTKQADGTNTHALYDVVRTPPKVLYTSETNSEESNAGYLNQIDPDGFTVGSADLSNVNNGSFVAWCWKAGGNKNTFSIDDLGYATAASAGLNGGTITPTGASVGTEQGFSIISYTGNATNGATFSHGLSSTPKMYVIKDRDSTSNWFIFNSNLPTNSNLYFNTQDAGFAAGGFAGASATSSLIQLPTGGSNTVNESNKKYICYAWHDVPGLQKFDKYTGNGAADGPYINCGFRPALLWVKNMSSGSTDWVILDTTTSVINPMFRRFAANQQTAQVSDSSTSAQFDFLSDGFKSRGGDGTFVNTSGDNYIYCAFAETPTNNLYGAQANAR